MLRCASEKIKDIDKYNCECLNCGYSWFFGPKEEFLKLKKQKKKVLELKLEESKYNEKP